MTTSLNEPPYSLGDHGAQQAQGRELGDQLDGVAGLALVLFHVGEDLGLREGPHAAAHLALLVAEVEVRHALEGGRHTLLLESEVPATLSRLGGPAGRIPRRMHFGLQSFVTVRPPKGWDSHGECVMKKGTNNLQPST